MGRPSKDGKFVNFLMDTELVKKLEDISTVTKKSKTAVLEKALREYIEPFYNVDGNIIPREAVYVPDGQPCVVLDEMEMRGKKYYKIYYNDDIVVVPAREVVFTD